MLTLLRFILPHLGRRLKGGRILIKVANQTITIGQDEPEYLMIARAPRKLLGLLTAPSLTFGRMFARGEIEVPELLPFLKFIVCNHSAMPRLAKGLQIIGGWWQWAANTQILHGRYVRAHYDLGNDFYRLWLDSTMTYSCAYFATGNEDLEIAQRAKIKHTLDKLNLKPGERLLDIGCGWGSAVEAAAKQYSVLAYGITLSLEQTKWIAGYRPNLLARVYIDHYHRRAERGKCFDAIVSIGMAEHVGRRQMNGYFTDVAKLLCPSGRALIHSITKVRGTGVDPFIQAEIFPGGYIPTLAELVAAANRAGLRVETVENIGPHYATTLGLWADNLEAREAEITAKWGAKLYRTYRLYLRACQAAFEPIRPEPLAVHQILLTK